MISIIMREWIRLSKQPKVMATTLLLPCFLIVLVIGIFFSGILEGDSQKIAVVADSARIETFFSENEIHKNISFYNEMNEELETMYDKGKVGVIIEIGLDEKKIHLQYDSTKISSSDLLTTAQEMISELALYLQDEAVYEAFLSNQFAVLEQDVSSIVDREEAQFKVIVSVLGAVLIFMVGQPLASFAIDSCVGEKERGTYDSIRLSGIEISQFVLGKTIFTVMVGMISCALQIVTIILAVTYFKGSFGVEQYIENAGMLMLTIALTGSISLALLVALLIYVSTYFEKVRDAGTYASIGVLIFTLLSQLSNVVDKAALEYIPLLNMNQLILKNAHGSIRIWPLFVSVLLGCVMVILLTQMSVQKLKREEM